MSSSERPSSDQNPEPESARLDGPGSGTPWLSVIIPTFNGERFLEACLKSIEIQDTSGIEVIISDDGSSDRSLEIIEHHSRTLPISVVHHAAAGNWIDNSNFAVTHARGDFLSFLHQDDVWMPSRLSVLRNALSSEPDLDLWVHDSAFIDDSGRVIGSISCPFRRSNSRIRSNTFVEHLLVQNFIMMPAPIIRRSTYLKVGGLDPSLWYTADWDLWLRMGLTGDVGYVARQLAGFRVHHGSQTWERSGQDGEVEHQLASVFEHAYASWSETDTRVRRSVHAAARLAAKTNVRLMRRLNGGDHAILGLAREYALAGPRTVYRTLRDSRIAPRATARLRVRFSRSRPR